jgi:hypothetical protein
MRGQLWTQIWLKKIHWKEVDCDKQICLIDNVCDFYSRDSQLESRSSHLLRIPQLFMIFLSTTKLIYLFILFLANLQSTLQ